MLLAVVTVIAAVSVATGAAKPNTAVRALVARGVSTALLDTTSSVVCTSVAALVTACPTLAAPVNSTASSVVGTASSLAAPITSSSPASSSNSTGTGTRTYTTTRSPTPGSARRPGPSAAPVLSATRLQLPGLTRLPSSAPFGPGVMVAKSKAILDLSVPPAVAPLKPLAGLNFASSPVFWPLLVVLDLLAVMGVVVLARRAWSRREPA